MVAARKLPPTASPVTTPKEHADKIHAFESNAPRVALRAPRSGLKSILSILATVAPKRSTMPILGCALVRNLQHEGVRFSATDLNMSATFTAPAWGGSDRGDLVINVRTMADTVKGMPDGEIDVRGNGSTTAPRADVTSGTISTSLEGFHGRDFPRITTPKDEIAWSTVPVADLLAAFDATDYAVCKDETRFHLNGIYIAPGGRETVATDGHRLALSRRDLKLTTETGKGSILPSAAVGLIRKVCKRGTCEIGMMGPHMFVRHEGWELALKLIDAQFPPYLQVIPTTYQHLVTVDRKVLLATANRASKIASSTCGMRLSVHADSLVVSCDGAERGSLSETLAAEGTGKEFAIGIQPKYLADTLEAIADERVTLAFGKELDPIVVRSVTDATTRALADSSNVAVIMPMRI